MNRNRPGPGLADFLVYSINPQVHAFDPLSMIENLEGQAYTVRTARSFEGNMPVCISPVTLKPRFNAVATSREEDAGPACALPERFDPRQASLFCAGWTLGSLKYLAESGVQSITYYETHGRGGVIHGRQEPASPDLFPAGKGDLYPVYFLWKELLKYRDFKLLASRSSHPLRFTSLVLVYEAERMLVLANHTDRKLGLGLPEGMAVSGSWVLDEYTVEDLRRGFDLWHNPSDTSLISLNPFAVNIYKTLLK